LHWSADEWKSFADTDATTTSVGLFSVDLDPLPPEGSGVRFTFFWTARPGWEGRDYSVTVGPARPAVGPR
jgi:hypothetical protein